MTLQAVIDAVADVCSSLVGADQVLTVMPPRLPDDRVFLVYVDPGPVLSFAHGGSNRGAVYRADEDIRIDFHIKAAADAAIEYEPEARTMLALFRNAIVAAMQPGGGVAATIFAFRGLTTDAYGLLQYWHNDTSFGWQQVLSITHGTEVTS